MYSNIDEAYDSPLKHQMKIYQKEVIRQNNRDQLINNIEDFQEENNLTPPHNSNNIDSNFESGFESGFDSSFESGTESNYDNNVSLPDINNVNPKIMPNFVDQPFYTSYGGKQNETYNQIKQDDLVNLPNYKPDIYNTNYQNYSSEGTPLSELKSVDSNFSSAAISDNGSLDRIYKKQKKKKQKKVKFADEVNHDNYVNIFMSEIYNDDSASSQSSVDVYKHIRKCSICKDRIQKSIIKEKSKNYKNNSDLESNQDFESLENLESFESSKKDNFSSNYDNNSYNDYNNKKYPKKSNQVNKKYNNDDYNVFENDYISNYNQEKEIKIEKTKAKENQKRNDKSSMFDFTNKFDIFSNIDSIDKDDIKEIIIVVLVGIFVIILLDTFMRVGKSKR
jgi:hypothetical protein